MPQRTLSQVSFFDPEFVMPNCLEPGTVPWLLARYRSLLFPKWLFEGWRGQGRLGRKAWPWPVLMTLVLLRWTEEGMSRLASVRRAKTDVVWRAAMGLQLGAPTPDEKTVRDFERFLRCRHPQAGVPRYLLFHEHIVRLCLTAGVVNGEDVWAMDSTPMWCYGAVMDTVRLLGDGTKKLARKWAYIRDIGVRQIAGQWGLPHLSAKSTKGAFQIDWHDSDARAGVIHTLAKGTLQAVREIRLNIQSVRPDRRKKLLGLCRTLVKVIGDNLETDDQGRLVIAQKVAKDRLISLTDPQARHGRKTRSRTFNGFKIHVIGDVVSGLIGALTVTAGNAHDGSVAHRLIRQAKYLHQDLREVLADTAYGGAKLRHRVSTESDVRVIAPPPPHARRQGRLGREDIDIDFEAKTATCAAGVTTHNHQLAWSKEHNCHVPVYRWPKATCAACPQREACQGNRQGGHIVRLHPYEQELRQAREDWKRPEIRQTYRTRSQCERLVNQVVRHGGRRARAWGLGSARFQAHAIASTCNLKLLAETLARSGQQ